MQVAFFQNRTGLTNKMNDQPLVSKVERDPKDGELLHLALVLALAVRVLGLFQLELGLLLVLLLLVFLLDLLHQLLLLFLFLFPLFLLLLLFLFLLLGRAELEGLLLGLALAVPLVAGALVPQVGVSILQCSQSWHKQITDVIPRFLFWPKKGNPFDY